MNPLIQITYPASLYTASSSFLQDKVSHFQEPSAVCLPVLSNGRTPKAQVLIPLDLGAGRVREVSPQTDMPRAAMILGDLQGC